jgi:hypothetical protein
MYSRSKAKQSKADIKELIAREAYLILNGDPGSLSIGAHWICVESAYKDCRAEYCVLKEKVFLDCVCLKQIPNLYA